MLKWLHKATKGDEYMIRLNNEKFIEMLNQKWSTKVCPMCGVNSWTVAENIYTLAMVEETGSIHLGKNLLPLIPVICDNCGNTILVNAKVTGCITEGD